MHRWKCVCYTEAFVRVGGYLVSTVGKWTTERLAKVGGARHIAGVARREAKP
jgi:hypothetical protein